MRGHLNTVKLNCIPVILVHLKSKMRYLTWNKQFLLSIVFCLTIVNPNGLQAQTGSDAWFDTLHDDVRSVIGDEEANEETPLPALIRDIAVDEQQSFAYVLDRFDLDGRVMVHDLETGSTCTFGSTGQGPDDFFTTDRLFEREGILFIIETTGKVMQFDVSEVGSCEDVEFISAQRIEIEAPSISDACFVGDAGDTMAAFDGRFTEREGFIHLFDASFAYKKSIGSLPPSYSEETDLYTMGAGSVYCLEDERIAATYEANHNILSVFSLTGETLQTISFDEYPAPTVNTRMMDGRQWYSWDMEDTYRIHQVTHIESDTYLVQLRAYDSGGPTEEREGVISYRVDIETGSKTRLGVGDREFAYYTDDLWIGIQQPYPMPRVFIHGR